MSATYHERFADELRAALPEGFTVSADQSITVAAFGTAALVGYTPRPGDKRKPITPAGVQQWITRETAALRRNAYNYTPQAKESATALLAALEPVLA